MPLCVARPEILPQAQHNAQSDVLRVREFVMRNTGSAEELTSCAGMLALEVDEGKGAMVRALSPFVRAAQVHRRTSEPSSRALPAG